MSTSEVYKFVQHNYNQKAQLTFWTCYTICDFIFKKGRRCNILVFGLGKDSILWKKANTDGRTLFIENSSKWIKKICGDKLEEEDWHVLKYKYRTTVKDSLKYYDRTLKELNELALPPELEAYDWDLILVDAPNGGGPKAPGRALPILWASKLAKAGTIVIIDDYRRKLERKYANQLLADNAKNWAVFRERNLLIWLEF